MGTDVISLIIFAACIVLFVIDKLPMATTAILGCVLMVVFGVCDFKTAFGQMASSTVVLTIGVMVIGAAISESGLAATVGRWIINVAKGSETKLIIGTYIVSALMSAFLTNSAVLAVFIPIVMGLSMSGEVRGRNLIMPIAIGCVLGGTATLVGSTQQMTAQGLLEDAGVRLFKTFDFTPIGGIIVIAGLVYCLTIGRVLAKKVWGDRPENSDYESSSHAHEYKRSRMITVAVIFIATVVLYITEWLPLAVTSTSAALLCIITGGITQKKAVAAVNWDIVGRLAGCLGIAKALESAGGTKLISESFERIVGSSIDPYLLFCILVLLVQLTSQFISNSTAIMIVLPILLSIAPKMGLDPYPFALGITIASGAALSCPLASSTLGMSMVAGYRFNDYFKHNFILDVINYALIITLVPLFYSLTV